MIKITPKTMNTYTRDSFEVNRIIILSANNSLELGNICFRIQTCVNNNLISDTNLCLFPLLNIPSKNDRPSAIYVAHLYSTNIIASRQNGNYSGKTRNYLSAKWKLPLAKLEISSRQKLIYIPSNSLCTIF